MEPISTTSQPRPSALPAQNAAGPAVQTAETPTTWPQDVYKPSARSANPHSVKGAGILDTLKRIFNAVVSGSHTVIPAALPAYPLLDPTRLAAADQAGKGRTIAQPLLSRDAAGTSLHDPVNFVIRGSRADLTKALESQGWVQAAPRTPLNFIKMGLSVLFHLGRDTGAPVSKQYLNGKGEDMAFNKNSDFGRGRDHLRVYNQGTDPKTGETIWAVAAVRDGGLTVTVPHPETNGKLWPWQWHWTAPHFNHEADEDIDGERDLVMKDLLASGLVHDWAAVDGQLPPGQSKTPTGDGRYLLIDRYPTDGKVYDLRLGARSS